MPADALGGTLPDLRPVMVAGEAEIEGLVRVARAGIANLSLQLRAAEEEARRAEAERGEADLGSAKDFLLGTIDRQVETRRRELASELDAARTDAASMVAATRTDAAAIVAAASAESLAVLLANAAAHGQPTAPSLRVVEEPTPDPTPVEPPPAHRSEWSDRGVVPIDAYAALSPEALARSEHPAAWTAAPWTAPAAPAVPVPTPTPVAPSPPPAPPAAGEPVYPGGPSYLVPSAPAPAEPVPTPAEIGAPVKRSSFKQFLYLDVLLPMIAVLVVIVVLLAWIG